MRYAETGYNLEIDLTRGNIEKVATPLDSAELYLGGQGSAAKLLWDRVPPETSPFSPDNLLIFSAGLLDATPVPGANRTSISSISPQSNQYVNAGLGGFFGPELKHAGYDKIVLRGKSPALVYIWINDDDVEIRDAGHLQGKSALETAVIIQEELQGAKIQVAAIGLAGENRVFQATIDHATSSASRGVGVIMGDKRVKAVAVRGTKDINIARPAELFEVCNHMYQKIYDNPHCGDILLRDDDDSWQAKNLAGVTSQGCVKGFLSTELQDEWAIQVEREQVSYQWENYSQEMEEVRETIVDKSQLMRGTGCYNCPKECHYAIALPGQRTYFLKNYCKLVYAMAAYEDLTFDYEILAALQYFGLDEFALPNILAFTVELYVAGILTDEDLPGFPTDNAGRLSWLIEKVARREGIGDVLANGTYWAAIQIGKGAEAYEHSAKKIEQVPRKLEPFNALVYLMYATGEKMSITQIEGSFPQSPIPDKNERAAFIANWAAAPNRFKQWFSEWDPGHPLSIEAAVNSADWNEAMHYADDAVGMCPLLSSFRGQYGGRPPYHVNNMPDFISHATGMEIDAERLLEIAARNRNLVRAINIRRGLRREEETPPEDILKMQEPVLEEKLLDAYYEFKGWTHEGIPAKSTLDRLGLGYVSEDFVRRGLYEVTK